MPRRGEAQRPKSITAQPTHGPVALAQRWWGKICLLLLTIVLLDLSFAPFKQLYLAWVALVPWLVMLRYCRSGWTAFWWSWLGGAAFFSVNMWWLVYITGLGMAALMAVLGLYWAMSGAVIRGWRMLEPRSPGQAVAAVFLIAAVWVGLEWLRATWPLGGLAWSYVGHSQTPMLALCQIADVTGVYGVTFWAMLINAWVALWLIGARKFKPVALAGVCVLAGTAVVLGYGLFRLSQHPTTVGPRVLVVQPNYPQSNSGEKGADYSEILEFHVRKTIEALRSQPHVDLVVWSETMMPPLNSDAAAYAMSLPSQWWQNEGKMWQTADHDLWELARRYHTAIVAGGEYKTDWAINKDEVPVPKDRRNSAFFYLPGGKSDLRYDKIHLVPFGEYLPFKIALPPLYRLFLSLSPYPEEYTLTAGESSAMTVFELRPGWRFVTPICFEDLDAELLRRMLAPQDGRKRADFIVNITNDGWFRFNEMPQHLQAAVFRSIENRVPTARSVNTGISGFFDSSGRTNDLVPAGREGTSVANLLLDRRVTFYARFGDVFAYACVAAVALLIVVGFGRWVIRRHRRNEADAVDQPHVKRNP